MQCWKLNETGQQWHTERGKNPWKDGGGSQWSQLSWPQTGKKSKKSQKKQSKKNGALPPIQFHSQTTNNRRQWATDEPKVSLSSSSHRRGKNGNRPVAFGVFLAFRRPCYTSVSACVCLCWLLSIPVKGFVVIRHLLWRPMNESTPPDWSYEGRVHWTPQNTSTFQMFGHVGGGG